MGDFTWASSDGSGDDSYGVPMTRRVPHRYLVIRNFFWSFVHLSSLHTKHTNYLIM